jgi:ketose-bisphosphate aldolase
MLPSSFNSILAAAVDGGYGVLALNVFDNLTLQTAVDVAEDLRSPLIIQTSVKTVRALGAGRLSAMFTAATSDTTVPVVLHLDHCPDREVVSLCIAHGWHSVLFDASHLPLAEATEQTAAVVTEAHAGGVAVEGEIEGIQGVEDGIGSDLSPDLYPIARVVEFIEYTGVDCFAPAIGNAHGQYKNVPTLDTPRVRALYEATRIPMALHGGSGLTKEQFTELIAAGCPKVNISTALKRAFVEGNRSFLRDHTGKVEPLDLISHVREHVADCVRDHVTMFGSAGKTL